MKGSSSMRTLKGQLTVRGIIIGCIGCTIITTSSVYVALKMGALPWPILFAAIVSLFFLKAFGKTNLNEVNVTHTVMSAGSMVAGGLAFTIPGIWILNSSNEVTWWQMLAIALCGVVLGLICTYFLRQHFIEKAQLEFPLGEAAAHTLKAGDKGGKVAAKLFGSLGFAGVFTALRDWFGLIPAMLFSDVPLAGVAFGIYTSPMLVAIGFIVGTLAVVVWFIGALISNFGIIVGGPLLGLWDTATGQGIASSLGMGIMMGCGVGVILKMVTTKLLDISREKSTVSSGSTIPAREREDATTSTAVSGGKKPSWLTAGLTAFCSAAVLLILCFLLELGPMASVIIVVFAWITTAMSAQSVGQTGIDPMEIFGLIVLIIVAALSDITQVQLFFVAAIIAVACGLTGDVMNDFRAGHIIGTNPLAQWIGQAVGGILGAFISVGIIIILVGAYGTSAFGPGETFIATQASIVATMIAGIPSPEAFICGLLVGCILYFFKVPTMMLGLGVYLPFYMSLTAFIGAIAKVIYDAIGKFRRRGLSIDDAAKLRDQQHETGLIVSSGLLGGESIAGVIIALISIFMFSVTG